MPKHDLSKNKVRDDASALGGHRFTIVTINQLIFGGSDREIDRGCAGGVGRVGGRCTIVFGLANPAMKNNKNIIRCGLRQPPETMF